MLCTRTGAHPFEADAPFRRCTVRHSALCLSLGSGRVCLATLMHRVDDGDRDAEPEQAKHPSVYTSENDDPDHASSLMIAVREKRGAMVDAEAARHLAVLLDAALHVAVAASADNYHGCRSTSRTRDYRGAAKM